MSLTGGAPKRGGVANSANHSWKLCKTEQGRSQVSKGGKRGHKTRRGMYSYNSQKDLLFTTLGSLILVEPAASIGLEPRSRR